ncbi:oxaloacetate acetylhydrolase [Mucidula mucida]|nr:oxaloacetate acetylhydrolase [Mucidula mucida]
MSVNPATKLRQMLAEPGIIVAPGIFDGISARCALEAGFQCLYQSGAATTASRLGQPDLAIMTLNDFVDTARVVCSLDPQMPIIADADTGFGGPLMVARTVTQYHRAGLAGLHIEDQVQTKRCGHLTGKQIVGRDEFVTRIRAAVTARDSIPGGSDLVIIARSDSTDMDEAITRLKLAGDARADICFLEAVRLIDDLQRTVKALAPKPVLYNAVTGGVSPSVTVKEAEAAGVKIIIFPLISAVSMVHVIRSALKSLKETGTDQFFEVMGLKEAIEIDAKVGASAFNTL